jgi:hypothetical protein
MKLNRKHLQLSMLLLSATLFGGCSRRGDPGVERQKLFNQAFAKLRSCVPPITQKADDNLKIAIAGVTLNQDETAVKIIGYTLDEDIDFDLPVYWMSRGRWLINEEGRSYLLDERCREYKLKDRRSSPGHPIPLNGRIRLNKGQFFEATLSFPSLSETQIGVLVYGDRTIPFWLLNQPQQR